MALCSAVDPDEPPSLSGWEQVPFWSISSLMSGAFVSVREAGFTRLLLAQGAAAAAQRSSRCQPAHVRL